MNLLRNFTATGLLVASLMVSLAIAVFFSAPAWAVDKKPNFLVIMGDDVGITNISAYSRGLMGYQTPNIDQLAADGALFTDYYGEQSCTAGRSTFITGQSPFRVGLTKVGMPGAKRRASATRIRPLRSC
jgi:arylsulfatase A-like enzyme